MSERTYYVLCEDNCRFEGMTKEQIIAAIAEATGSTPTSIDDAFITKIKEMNANKNLKFWIGTTAQFNALATKAADTMYILSDDDTEESLETAIANLQTSLQNVISGTTPVANATNATNATNANNVLAKDNTFKALSSALLEMVYPVGSIYMTVNNVSPQSFLGGTWVAWGAGKVPVGVDTNDTDFDTVEETGGEKEHTLTVNEMPAHTHDAYVRGLITSTQKTVITTASEENSKPFGVSTSSNGGGAAHNNLQPYITCYMWKRTA